MKLTPLADRVIIKADEQPSVTPGGIFIPDLAKEKPTIGVVVAVGPGKFDETGKRIPMNLKVGDSVFYGKYSGTEVKFQGEQFSLMREVDVYAVIGE